MRVNVHWCIGSGAIEIVLRMEVFCMGLADGYF